MVGLVEFFGNLSLNFLDQRVFNQNAMNILFIDNPGDGALEKPFKKLVLFFCFLGIFGVRLHRLYRFEVLHKRHRDF